MIFVSLLALLGASAAERAEVATERPASAPLDDRAIGAALCPIVYQVDRDVPSPRGYHYLFYGNGFFIDKSGYLLTDAHVLDQLHGGQPYLLLRKPGAAPYFVQANVVALSREHDVAILRAMPNPFDDNPALSFLPLARTSPNPGERLVAAALRPFAPRDAYSLDGLLEERPSGDVLHFEFSRLGSGPAETELFLFNHAIHPGQSGAPVISLESRAAVGLVEGEWLREDSIGSEAPRQHSANVEAAPPENSDVAPIPGAAIPIHYALALLQQKNLEWHSAPQTPQDTENGARENEASALPSPLSLIAAPYPQSLFGGEVMLDAVLGRNGTLSDIRVVRGADPFLRATLDAVRTWTFFPARASGQPVDARIAIAFEFVEPYIPPREATVHRYAEDSRPSRQDGAAFALTTVEPQYPSGKDAEGSVILYEEIDREGQTASVQTVAGAEPLTSAVMQTAKEWQFVPAIQRGTAVESAAVLVVSFRHALVTSQTSQPSSSGAGAKAAPGRN